MTKENENNKTEYEKGKKIYKDIDNYNFFRILENEIFKFFQKMNVKN